jgi:hypothetical protein
MDSALFLLVLAGTVGSVDVLYYHLYRFRLFARRESALEEATHLVRHAIFLALLVAISSHGVARSLVVGLFALDVANSAVDVLLERRSREGLGGLPSLEMLVHTVSSFLMGLAFGAYLFVPEETPFFGPSGLLALQVQGMLAVGVVLLLAEGGLFLHAVTRARRATGGALVVDASPIVR